jgi:RNA polymerase sigma factor (sigma-70 family)
MDHDEVREHETDVTADADLVLRTRTGDTDAFGELWRRHYRAGVTVARNMTSSLDADDLVQEAYTRIYHSIVNGGGPTGSFRAYLFTSIRNTAAAWGRARRETPYDELDGVEDPSAAEHHSEAALDRSLTHQAFRSLPSRWQEVLWYSEIEQMKPAEIAPLLGMKATAVAQLTFRAREGLREAWIQAHLRSVADGSECQWAIERLGAYTRRNLGRRDHAKLERHLADCVRCAIVASEAREVSGRLALVLLPLALGAAGTAGYLATVQGSGATLVALAAMPSSVVHGAATVGPVGVTGTAAGSTTAAATTTGAAAGAVGGSATAGTGVGAGAAAISSSAGAAGAAATAVGSTTAVAVTAAGSSLAGIGAASGLAAASLVVVGGVVAAAVALPPIAPEPDPKTVSSNSTTTDAPEGVAGITDGGEDLVLRLPDEPGPGPADIPVVADPVTDGAGTAADGGSTTGDGEGSPTAGAGNGSTGNGQDTGGNAGNGNTGGNTGNGNTGNTGETGANGDPTNGTGNGNGGTTGNDGSTGNGDPTNGTGNGNGGNTGGANGNGGNKGGGNDNKSGDGDPAAGGATGSAPTVVVFAAPSTADAGGVVSAAATERRDARSGAPRFAKHPVVAAKPPATTTAGAAASDASTAAAAPAKPATAAIPASAAPATAAAPAPAAPAADAAPADGE